MKFHVHSTKKFPRPRQKSLKIIEENDFYISILSLNMDVVILRKNIMVSDKSFHLKYIPGNIEIERGIEDRDQST